MAMQALPAPLPPAISDIVDLLIAFILAVPIGWNREREDRSAGIRTFPIVAIASCALTLITAGLKATPDAYSRILQGLVTGIGFIGGGAILKERGSVSGTATAASVWNMGIIGASVGLHMYHVAIVLTVVNFLTLKFLIPLKDLPPERR
jgi:putative Mg2+ transporter-C (MgtC) family protein